MVEEREWAVLLEKLGNQVLINQMITFLRKPGEIKITTKIGDNGRAVKERRYSDHKQPWAHS